MELFQGKCQMAVMEMTVNGRILIIYCAIKLSRIELSIFLYEG